MQPIVTDLIKAKHISIFTNMYTLVISISLSFCLALTSVYANNLVDLDNEDDLTRYHQLTHDLRCLVCQNQNIAESNAGLAKDLKTIIVEKIKTGKSDQEIKDFMVQRYGEFVLYEPRFKGATILLWLAPFILFILVAIIAIKKIHSGRHANNSRHELLKAKAAQAESLLSQHRNNP